MMKKSLLCFAMLCLLFCFPALAEQEGDGAIMVVFKNPATTGLAQTEMVKVQQARAVSLAEAVGAHVVKVYEGLTREGRKVFALFQTDAQSEDIVVQKLLERPDVLSASKSRRFQMMDTTPNDPEYTQNSLWGLNAINAPAAWDITTGSDDVYVAVMDTGIQYDHPDLAKNFDKTYSRNFARSSASEEPDYSAYGDFNGHGTHVAGIIGGVGNNEIGVAGVNWKTKIISLRVFAVKDGWTEFFVIEAIDYLIKLLEENPGLKLAAVNMSFGNYDPLSPQDMKSTGNVTLEALSILSKMNRAVICVASGNYSIEVGKPAPEDFSEECQRGTYVYPASFLGLHNMVVVAGAKSETELDTSYSNYSSTYVDIAAPGTNIKSTTFYDGYTTKTGTSAAAPYVAGAAALLKSAYPSATAYQCQATDTFDPLAT